MTRDEAPIVTCFQELWIVLEPHQAIRRTGMILLNEIQNSCSASMDRMKCISYVADTSTFKQRCNSVI